MRRHGCWFDRASGGGGFYSVWLFRMCLLILAHIYYFPADWLVGSFSLIHFSHFLHVQYNIYLFVFAVVRFGTHARAAHARMADKTVHCYISAYECSGRARDFWAKLIFFTCFSFAAANSVCMAKIFQCNILLLLWQLMLICNIIQY